MCVGMGENTAERLGWWRSRRVLTRGGNPWKPWEHAKEDTVGMLLPSPNYLRNIFKIYLIDCLLFVITKHIGSFCSQLCSDPILPHVLWGFLFLLKCPVIFVTCRSEYWFLLCSVLLHDSLESTNHCKTLITKFLANHFGLKLSLKLSHLNPVML